MLVGLGVLLISQQTRSPISQGHHTEFGFPKLRVLYLHGDDRLLSVSGLFLLLAVSLVLIQA